MRILFLGNSFTFYNALENMVSLMLDEPCFAVTRGGSTIAEHINPETEMGRRTAEMLADRNWDYVVLQEQSFAPAGTPDAFLASAAEACRLIHEAGATPVFFNTWAYEDGSEKLAGTGLTYDEMLTALNTSYTKAAAAGNALRACVGDAFKRAKDIAPLYMATDNYHPSLAGSYLAALTIARIIAPGKEITYVPAMLDKKIAKKLQEA